MANLEFEQSDLLAAAKAFGCEDCLPKNNPLLPKEATFYDQYVQQALKGSVSFSPDEPDTKQASCPDLLKFPSRSERRGLGKFVLRDQARNLMTKRPGYER